jgi:hypothetical protein
MCSRPLCRWLPRASGARALDTALWLVDAGHTTLMVMRSPTLGTRRTLTTSGGMERETLPCRYIRSRGRKVESPRRLARRVTSRRAGHQLRSFRNSCMRSVTCAARPSRLLAVLSWLAADRRGTCPRDPDGAVVRRIAFALASFAHPCTQSLTPCSPARFSLAQLRKSRVGGHGHAEGGRRRRAENHRHQDWSGDIGSPTARASGGLT